MVRNVQYHMRILYRTHMVTTYHHMLTVQNIHMVLNITILNHWSYQGLVKSNKHVVICEMKGLPNNSQCPISFGDHKCSGITNMQADMQSFFISL